MIERLVTSLRALASRPSDAAADDFEDALLLVRQCQGLQLTLDQSGALDRLERCLSLPGSSERVRAEASAALSALMPESSQTSD